VRERVANVRSDTGAVLGVVGNDYRILQNREAFAFMDDLVGEKLAMFETAGSLREGRRVWMMARIPKELRPAGTQDTIQPYVLLANSHDGSMSVRMIPTTVRVVCQNTLHLALSRAGTSGLRIGHYENLHDRIDEARQKLGIVLKRFDRFQQELDALAKVSLTETQVTDYFPSVFKLSTPRPTAQPVATDGAALLDNILEGKAAHQALAEELIQADREHSDRKAKADARLLEQLLANFDDRTNTLPGVRGTAWAAFNAVSEYVDHQGRTRGRTEAEKADTRLGSIWFGRGDQIKQEAYQAALQLAG